VTPLLEMSLMVIFISSFQATRVCHVKTVPQDLLGHPKVFTLASVNLVNAMVMQVLAIQRLESVWTVDITQQGIIARPVPLVMLVML
jgi:hypothetical protein